ncbi:hypothetical protein D560_3728 [Bordetella holmesii ATCC 51541]|nr:hypothetical protein D560_3728 [Bordetella holmesii ATCC 51541]
MRRADRPKRRRQGQQRSGGGVHAAVAEGLRLIHGLLLFGF